MSASRAPNVAGLVAWSLTAATFFLDFTDHDLAEGFGLFAFVIGLFLLWEGGFALLRLRMVAARDKPR